MADQKDTDFASAPTQQLPPSISLPGRTAQSLQRSSSALTTDHRQRATERDSFGARVDDRGAVAGDALLDTAAE